MKSRIRAILSRLRGLNEAGVGRPREDAAASSALRGRAGRKGGLLPEKDRPARPGAPRRGGGKRPSDSVHIDSSKSRRKRHIDRNPFRNKSRLGPTGSPGYAGKGKIPYKTRAVQQRRHWKCHRDEAKGPYHYICVGIAAKTKGKRMRIKISRLYKHVQNMNYKKWAADKDKGKKDKAKHSL